MRVIGSNTYSLIPIFNGDNLTFMVVTNVDPTAGDDNTLGFEVNYHWFNETNGKEFILFSNGTGTANWKQDLDENDLELDITFAMTNNSGVTLTAGECCAFDTTTDFSVISNTSNGNPRAFVVVVGGVNGAQVRVRGRQITMNSSAAVTRGDFMASDLSNPGDFKPFGSPSSSTNGMALESIGGAGAVEVIHANETR